MPPSAGGVGFEQAGRSATPRQIDIVREIAPDVVLPGSSDDPTIWTIGHSSHPAETFLGILERHRIGMIADVRRFPGSRAHPHFGSEALAGLLAEVGIEYTSLPELGGRRKPRPDSVNTRWRNESFRGYADHLSTGEFEAGLRRLLELTKEHRVAIMCSEALWWRCHRALIADVLKLMGMTVLHIQTTGDPVEHPFTSAARVRDGVLDYGPDAIDGDA